GLGAEAPLVRLAEQPPGRILFVLAVWDFDARHHEQCRVHAADDRDRTWLSEFVPAPHDQVAVLALRGHDRGDVLTLRLDAVGAVVDPAGVGMAHDHHAAGADVATPVV